MRSVKAWQLAGLWAAVAVGYFLIRSTTPLVWDDTPLISAARYEHALEQDLRGAEPWRVILERSFCSLQGNGYRPLNIVQRYVGVMFFGPGDPDPAPWFAVGGAILGLMTVCVFLVARRYCGPPAALLAAFLLLFATPTITGAWPVVMNMQATVPLMICLGLLTYWRLAEATGARRWACAAALAVVLLVGPWVREFIGIVPLLILWEEWKRARRPTWVMALAGVFFLHALFPTALMKVLIFPNLSLRPVFAMGHLAEVLETAGAPAAGLGIIQHLRSLKWDVPNHFLVLYPPLLLGLGALAYGVQAVSLALAPAATPGSRLRALRPLAVPSVLLFGAGTLYLAQSPYLGFWLVLGVAAVCARVNGLLGVWFLLSFLPFLKLFTEQVHLAYSLVPASIGLAGMLERAAPRLRGVALWRRGVRWAVVVLFLVGVADHALNLYASHRVVAATNRVIYAMARWFRANVPAGSVVICNALHLEDIRLASGNHFAAYWTVACGIPADDKALPNPAALEKFLRANAGKRPVYFLDVDYPFTPDKEGYHSHQYVRNHNVSMEPLGKVRTLRVRYAYLDPFKKYTPRPLMSFLGAPDLENDFYRGPAQGRTRFLREVYAEYHVYRVTGTRVAEKPSPVAAGPAAPRP
jgi:hypothetical protein